MMLAPYLLSAASFGPHFVHLDNHDIVGWRSTSDIMCHSSEVLSGKVQIEN